MEAETIGSVLGANKSVLLRKRGVIGVARGKDKIVVFQDKTEANKEELPKEINGVPIRVIETGPFRFLGATNDNDVKITVTRKIAVPEIRSIQTIGCSDFRCCFRVFYTQPIPVGCEIHAKVNEEECSIIKHDSGSIDIVYYCDFENELAFVLWLTCGSERGAESKQYIVDTSDQICAYIIDNDKDMCAAVCFWYSNTCNTTPRELIDTPDRMRVWDTFAPGVGVGESDAPKQGTFGGVVIKGGKRMLLSCRHAIVPYTGIGDTKVIQGSKDNKIGEVKFLTEYKEQPDRNYADCAIAEVYNDAKMLTEILDKSGHPTILPTGTTEPYIGQKVIKSGAKTGFVTGEVLYTGALATILREEVPYDFEDVIVTTLISKDGDSGSLLLEEGTNKVVGLVFAADRNKRYTFACKVSNVLTAMGCTLDTLPTVEEEGIVRITATSQIPLYYSDDSNGPQRIPCSSRVVWDQDNQICDARYEAEDCWNGAHVISSLTFPYSSGGIVVKYLSDGSMYDDKYRGFVTANHDNSTLHITLTEYPTVGVEGAISLPASTIPTTLYQQTPSVFDMAVINTGTVEAEYQVAITFVGIDVANEEVFWSAWSGEVAPNGSTTLPVQVELSEEAIPEGAETAEYNIFTRLVAR